MDQNILKSLVIWGMAIVIFTISLIFFFGREPTVKIEESVYIPSEISSEILEQARGKSVNVYAWGGSEEVNAYFRWAAQQLKNRFDIEVNHVKVNDTGNVVAKLLAYEIAGQSEGEIDVIWINGENFKKLKQANLLHGPFTEKLLNIRYVEDYLLENSYDFSELTEGLEAPWGQAQLTFFYDSDVVPVPPRNANQLLDFAKRNPKRFTYPEPPDFHGTTFLKQILFETLENKEVLYEKVDEALFLKYTEDFWDYLDNLHPHLWNEGKSFPSGIQKMHTMLDNREIFISFSFNPNELIKKKKNRTFSFNIRSYGHEDGTIANAHFLAIPRSSASKDAALVFIDFMLSPEAQGRKNDTSIWGDPTVLSFDKLNEGQRAFFVEFGSKNSIKKLREPHADWVEFLENEWRKRYVK